MPHSTTLVMPRWRNSTSSVAMSATSDREDSDRETQASRLPDSSSASAPQSVRSRVAIRPATPSAASRSTTPAKASSSG